MKRISLAVTTDLNHDQRMQRIAISLQQAGYRVSLIGRTKKLSHLLLPTIYRSYRLHTFFERGFLFYALFNIRLFFLLMSKRSNAICAVDLDTLPACWLAARLKGNLLFYDAHELFTEVPELLERPRVRRIWEKIENYFVPRVDFAYTVNQSLADWYSHKYNRPFAVVRNMPFSRALLTVETGNYILYQGALNAGRGLECLLEAVKLTAIPCILAGDGDLSPNLLDKVKQLNISSLVTFTGMLTPTALHEYTSKAWVGINLLVSSSPNYYYSLANKFFDYVQAGKPQFCMAFPEYKRLQADFEVAVLMDELDPSLLAAALLGLKSDPARYKQLAENCQKASLEWIWELEENKLLLLYAKL